MKELLVNFRSRAFAVSFNTLRAVMPSVTGFIISVVVVRYFSKELWGAVAAAMLWVYFSSNICAWGNREFVLRQFSRFPPDVFSIWGDSLLSRVLLLATVLAAVAIASHGGALAVILCLCIASRFVYQSFEPIVVYQNRFAFIASLEIIAMLLFLILLFVLPHPDLNGILMVYAITDLFKTVIAAFVFRDFIFAWPSFRFGWRALIGAFPFFLLGISQLLHSRISQFFVNSDLANGDKAFYQVYINLLLYVAAIPDYMVTPFLKKLFVSDQSVYRKLIKISLLGSFAIVPCMLFIILVLLTYVFHFQVSSWQLLLGYLFVLPGFYYALRMYYYFSVNKENVVVVINFSCVAVSALLSFLLIPRYGMNGALITAAASQWLTAILYFVLAGA